MKKIISLTVLYSLFLVVICRPVIVDAQTTVRSDPRGLNRYTLNGTKKPLSIFTLPQYDRRIGESKFFDGFGRKTATELGLENAEFCNEFGDHAECGNLEGKAVIRFKNGMVGDEAYLEGCLKNGKTFFNRIKIYKKPPPPVVVEKVELCSNIAIAVKDVPSDWTITRTTSTVTCNFPVPPAPEAKIITNTVDNTCKPGVMNRIFEEHNKKGFNPQELVTTKLTGSTYDIPRIMSLMAVTEATSKLTDLVIYYNGCDYAVYGLSVVKGGLGWWKWVIPALIAAAFLLGRLTVRCPVTPIKVEVRPPDRGPL